ncbi:MAG: hypothetical protein J7L96_01885, partial [Bacteroidales bacterium]|nr:hypothetical protein [Bacteroidales bacterium]
METILNFRYISFKATSSREYPERWREIAHRARRFIDDHRKTCKFVQLIWFFDRQEGVSCRDFKQSIRELEEMSLFESMAQTFVPQPPAGDCKVELIIRYIHDPGRQFVVHFKSSGDEKYASITSGNNCFVLVGGLGCSDNRIDVTEQASIAFSDLQTVLAAENLNFRHIMRQWNYIDDIVGISFRRGKEFQHYQEFNEVRAAWYSKNGLSNNFPAATGIGTFGGGVIVEGIAARLDTANKLYSIANPSQEDAHSYSKTKLVGDLTSSVPLFERGKMLVGKYSGYIWVSGTAAIRGQDSVSGSLSDQTRITCENIDELI